MTAVDKLVHRFEGEVEEEYLFGEIGQIEAVRVARYGRMLKER